MHLPNFARPKFSLFTGFVLSLCVGFFHGGVAHSQQTAPAISVAPPLVVQRVDNSSLIQLKGNTRPETRTANDRGRVPSEFPMNGMILVLRRGQEQQQAFDSFVASQYQPSSPNFHHWLTPEEVGQKFGPSPADIAVVTQWLQSAGFTVNDVAKNHLAIRFSGTAGRVQAAFHTEIHSLQVNGESRIANVSDPQIPAALAPVVVGIQALHNFMAKPLHRLGNQVRRDKTGAWHRIAKATGDAVPIAAAFRAKPLFGTLSSGGDTIEDITPSDFASIYNVQPLWDASIDGTGQTIAIVGSSNIILSDVATFRSSFGLPPKVPTVVIPATSTDPGACENPDSTDGCFDSQIENTLDVEWAGAIAKNAEIILVASNPGNGADFNSDPVYISADYIIQQRLSPIMNVSYGNCEALLGTAGNAGFNTLWQTAAAEGIAVMVASGDSGSPACDRNPNNETPFPAQDGLAVNGLATPPYATAVGGTDLNWGTTAAPYWNSSNDSNGASALGYIPEIPWNQSCTNPVSVTNITNIANLTGLGTVTDAESACNFIYNNYLAIEKTYGVDLSPYINTVGGGGGVSACTVNDFDITTGEVDTESCTGGYTKPTWQASLTPADGKRDIPDVSFFASSGFLGSSYLICLSLPSYGFDCDYSSGSESIYEEVGGTSVASPIMAGVMALVNQKTGASQGNPNTELYALAGLQNYPACSAETATAKGSACIFNDIDTGNNAIPCVAGSPDCTLQHPSDPLGVIAGYNALRGYDLATGLGSVNVANLVNNFPNNITPISIASLSATLLDFPATTVKTAAASQKVTLQNTGSAILNIASVSILGNDAASFSEVDNCVGAIPAFASCIISVTFDPVVDGGLTATLSIADDSSPSSVQTVSLSGSGIARAPVLVLSPTSLSFASTPVGTTTGSKTVSVQNTGTSALVISSINLGGTDAASFSQTNNCSSVAPGSSCVLTVGFQPTGSGARTAVISVIDNSVGSPHTVGLTGIGAQPAVPGTYRLSATAITIPAGASGTSIVTAASTDGYIGTVTLTCSLIVAPAGANTSANPTCVVGDTIGMPGIETATLRIQTTSTTTSMASIRGKSQFASGGVALSLMFLFGLPAIRRRKSYPVFALLLLLASMSAVTGCAGGGAAGTSSHTIPGTTAGVYTYTVSGVGNDGATTKASMSMSVTVQ